MMMLRILRSSALLSSSTRQRQQLLLNRTYAAAAAAKSKSKAKRALSKQQVEGSKNTTSKATSTPAAATTTASSSAPKTPDAPPTKVASTTSSSTRPPSGGGGGGGGSSSLVPVAGIGLLVVGAGAYAYYNNMIPGLNDGAVPEEAIPAKVETTGVVEVEEKKAPVEAESKPDEEQPLPTTVETTNEEPAPPKEEEEKAEEAGGAPSGNRVLQIAPIPTGVRSTTTTEITHPKDGHRVSMDVASKESPKSALDELKAAVQIDSSRTLQEAHTSLRTQAFDMWLTDLENLTPEALRIRVVQLVSELQERTKWEAVRLKEFLIMREKETGEKYLELMQKERMELEAKLASSLREKEDDLTRKMNAQLAAKDAQVEAVVKAATDAAAEDHAADLASAKARLEAEIGAASQVEFSQALAEHKAEFVKELEAKVATIQDLAQKLKQLDAALAASRSYENGSLKAHRVSAAALALAEKLETSGSGVGPELDALANAAQGNEVVTSALASLPGRLKEMGGVPTVAELQTRFASVADKARQASFVPKGREGLEGQLLGWAFSTIKYAPNPDDVAPEDEKYGAEYVLARAGKHVKLGELERAVEQLNKLSGQAAFTIQDWKESAQERISTDKALQAIKMECALLNETYSSSEAGK